MKGKWLINPFERIAGWQALTAGLAVMALTALIGAYNSIHFSGLMNTHFYEYSLSEALLNQLVNLMVISLIIWFGAKAIVPKRAHSIRLIDVSGTFALARTPYLLSALFGFIPPIVTGYAYLVVVALVWILITIWVIALTYNAFVVSCNIKGTKGIIFFIGSLIVSEIASLAINYYVKQFVVCTLVVGISQTTPAPEPEQEPTDVIHQIAENVVDALQKKDYNAIVVYFDDTMKKVLTEQKLSEMSSEIGKLVKADTKVKSFKQDGYDFLRIPCTFERTVSIRAKPLFTIPFSLTLQLVFNEKGQISGMYLH